MTSSPVHLAYQSHYPGHCNVKEPNELPSCESVSVRQLLQRSVGKSGLPRVARVVG